MTHDYMRQLANAGTPENKEELRAVVHGLRSCVHQLLDEATAGIALIAAERQRQVESEGWTAEHDDEHSDGSLARAGACYAMVRPNMEIPFYWPWDPSWWKPSPDPIRNLAKAGALIAAEIDRLLRKQAKQ